VGFLGLWTVLAALSSLVCYWRASHSRGVFALLGLLLGPGAIPLVRVATLGAEFAPSMAAVAMLGGLFASLVVMSHSFFQSFRASMEGYSLALPLPTYVLMDASRIQSTHWAPLGWTLVFVLPTLIYKGARRIFFVESTSGEDASVGVLLSWARVLPIFVIFSTVLNLVLYAFFKPWVALTGYIGG